MERVKDENGDDGWRFVMAIRVGYNGCYGGG